MQMDFRSTKMIAATALAGTLALGACSDDPRVTPSTNTNSYSDGPVWQGNTCMARTKDGRQVRVNPSNCPPKPAS